MADKPSTDEIAIAMRKALNEHQTGNPPIPWDKAQSEAKAEWRVCAEAAIEAMSKRSAKPGGKQPVAG